MTTVYFVRHAEPNFNNHDDLTRELSEKGLIDRQSVTKFLADKKIDIVLSSPYKRAIDTIKHFADSKGLAIVTITDFRERKVDSVWIDDFNSFCERQWSDFDYKLCDGETLNEVQSRNISALSEALDKYKDKNIVIGTHGTALSTIINYYDNSFNYERFSEIKNLMPWVVCMKFNGQRFLGYKSINLFICS